MLEFYDALAKRNIFTLQRSVLTRLIRRNRVGPPSKPTAPAAARRIYFETSFRNPSTLAAVMLEGADPNRAVM